MEAAEAAALLKAVAEIDRADRTQDADIDALIAELGRLPLALSHAAACIKLRRVTVKAYRERYTDSLLDSKAALPTGDLYQRVVASTWDESIAAADASAEAQGVRPLGRLLLTACAYLSPDGVPRSLLRRWLTVTPLLHSAEDVDVVLDATLAALSSQSLVQYAAADNPSIRVHPVLGRLLRRQHERLQRRRLLAPGDAIEPSLPILDDGWYRPLVSAVTREYELSAELPAQRDVGLLSQMQSLRQTLDRSDCGWLGSISRAELLSWVGELLLSQRGEYAVAKAELEASLAIYKAQDDSESWEIGLALSRLGAVSTKLGDYSTAGELLRRAARVQADYDVDDVQLAPTLGSLANALLALGESAEAKELLERVLVINEAHYGPHHVLVAATLTDLACACGSVGDDSKQRELLERALAIQQQQSCKSEPVP